MATNTLVFQEGTEINVDTGSATPAAGWTINYLAVVRTGPLVVMHIEATGSAGAVFTLPPDLRPADNVTDGTVSVNASTGVVSSSGAAARTTLAWTAGQASP